MQISALKTKIRTMLRLCKKPKRMIYPLAQNGFFKWLPDELYLKILFWAELDRKLDFKNPILFSEKIQWLKLYDRNPLYTKMVDKYLVKSIVADIIGEEYIVPSLGVWGSADQIDFQSLPDRFVLKCNHDSGGIIICKDKKKLDKNKTITFLKRHLERDSFYFGREWAYRGVVPKIIAEELLVDPDHTDLIDYKFYCFNAKPVYCQVIKDRYIDETIDFYDMEWNRMPFTGLGVGLGPKRGGDTPKPVNYTKMIEIASILSQGTTFVRIDLYNIAGKIYFGEFTLYPKSGLGFFYPDEWNVKMGNMIVI